MAGDVAGAAESPKISKPRPAPPGPSNLPPLPPAAIDNALAIGGEDINARMKNTRMTVDVMVNGRGPYRFLVDSGADTSVVGLRIASELQLPLGSPAILNGMTSRNVVDQVKVAELTLGQSTIRDLEVPALREQDLGGEGMIGIDALVEQRLMMDFEKRVIKAEDASRPARMMDGEIVVTARRRRGQLILTEVKASGLPLEAVIDTGSEVTIGNLALRDKLIKKNREKFVDVEVTGVTGVTLKLKMARVSQLQLGSVILKDVPVAFADAPPFAVFGMANEPALLIGTDLLETFRRVSLDFRRRKVRFQLRQCGLRYVSFSSAPSDFFSRIQSGPDASVCKRG
jgi:hypothetical protein